MQRGIVKTIARIAVLLVVAASCTVAGQQPVGTERLVLTNQSGVPAFIVLYHPPPKAVAMRPASTQAAFLSSIQSHACFTLDEVLEFLDQQEIDEASLIGVWKLADSTKVDLKATETVVPVAPLRTRKWQKKP